MGFSVTPDRMVWPPSLSRDRTWPRVTICTHSWVIGLRLECNLVIQIFQDGSCQYLTRNHFHEAKWTLCAQCAIEKLLVHPCLPLHGASASMYGQSFGRLSRRRNKYTIVISDVLCYKTHRKRRSTGQPALSRDRGKGRLVYCYCRFIENRNHDHKPYTQS